MLFLPSIHMIHYIECDIRHLYIHKYVYYNDTMIAYQWGLRK